MMMMMLGLSKMNAARALVLALAIGVTHCELQQDPLMQQDEDLFFPESLLIDPVKQSDISDDYNSLEAPKEVEGNGLDASKEDINGISKTKSSIRAIPISVLAKESSKNHIDHSYFPSQKESSSESDSSETSEEDDDDSDSEEGSANYEGSGRPHFNWDIEGSADDYGSGEVDGSGDYNIGQDDYENGIDFLAEADLEEFIPIRSANISSEVDSQIDVEYDEDKEDDNKIFSPPKNNLVIQGYGGSTIGEIAKIEFLENEMHQVKGQISQLIARMEQQSNDIGHLQSIILQLQEQIITLIYRQQHPKDK